MKNILLKVKTSREIPNLCDIAANRVYTIDGVVDVEAIEIVGVGDRPDGQFLSRLTRSAEAFLEAWNHGR